MATDPVLYLLCGKIASGKSTLAARLAAQPVCVLISEDAWLAPLYGAEMSTLADYVRCSQRLREAMGPHVVALLKAGVSVVLDFPANTPGQRAWMRGLIEAAGVRHELHLLDAPDALCLERLHARNAAGEHPFAATEAQFRAVTRHFSEPAPDEGFTIIRHPASSRA